MKARTKLQLEVTELTQQLPKLTEAQKKWVFDKCLLHKAYYNKTSIFCLDCGNTFDPKFVKNKQATCPHCHTKVKAEYSRTRTDHQLEYISLAMVYGDFQVISNFEIKAHYKKGRKVEYIVRDVLEYWINPKGKLTMIGELHHMSYYGDSWSWGNWAIRKEGTAYYNSNKYRILPYKYLPESQFKKEYARIGIDKNLIGLTVLEAITILPENPQAETLLKAKQYHLLNRLASYPNDISSNWASIKICIRNKYIIKDASMWLDYIEFLKHFGNDLRSPVYVCPKDLKKEHDIFLARKTRQRDRARAKIRRDELNAEQLRKDYLAQFPYTKRKAAYMGITFSNKIFKVTFLKSESAIKREGKILKHCVYESEYQNKDTLLFSATMKGKKIATIEVDPKRLEVLQVRGYDNLPMKYDKEILSLVRSNMKLIAKAGKPKRKKRSLKLAS